MRQIPIKPSARRSIELRARGCPRTLIGRKVGSPADVHPQRRQAFRCLFFALAVIAFATSCGHDAGGAAPAVGQFVATVNPVTTAPTPTYDPATARETLVLPRHDEPLLVNRGDRYVYGELSLSGDCLRISYVDPSEDPWTQDGLLLVWTAGFDVRTEDDVVEVTGADGGVVAAIGQTLRVSGKHVSDRYAVVDEWDWDGGEAGHCAGPYWLVGDEVTAKTPNVSAVGSDDGIFFPRLNHQRGPIGYPLVGVRGRLALRGRCLLLEIPHPPGAYLVVWPPGFYVHRMKDDVIVRNGGGSVIAQVGDDVSLGGDGQQGADYSDECPGAYFWAYTVQRSPAR